ncbi:MAG: aminotransferase class V-fold PLP-dependent enzyme [Alphaproteobacteria bacterium]
MPNKHSHNIPPRYAFPILQKKIRGNRFCYLDSAASAQKPIAVIEKQKQLMENSYANVHRGAYLFAENITSEYETSRATIANFINAEHDEVIFTNGATFGFNLIAHAYGRHILKKGDKILLSIMEHHANMVPWQMLRDEMGVELIYIGIDENGDVRLDELYHHLPEAKLLAITHCSNVSGAITPIKDICQQAKKYGVVSVVDGAQSICHQKIDVKHLGCDFFIFSGHKIYGPTGVGILYGRAEILKTMPPFFGGGDMIESVTLEKTTFADPPARFEAGTPPIIEVIALASAIAWLCSLPLDAIYQHEKTLADKLRQRLENYPQIKLFAKPKNPAPLVSFFLKNAHPHDIATLLDQSGVAIRAGHHCAMPLHHWMAQQKNIELAASARLSFAIYNDEDDVLQFFDGFDKALKILKL